MAVGWYSKAQFHNLWLSMAIRLNEIAPSLVSRLTINFDNSPKYLIYWWLIEFFSKLTKIPKLLAPIFNFLLHFYYNTQFTTVLTTSLYAGTATALTRARDSTPGLACSIVWFNHHLLACSIVWFNHHAHLIATHPLRDHATHYCWRIVE